LRWSWVPVTNAQDRLRGFKRALLEKKIHIDPEYIQETNFDQQGGYAKTMLLLRMIPRPTLIFAANDMIAFGALLAFREAGLHCPEDISLIGFDNLQFAEMTSPRSPQFHSPDFRWELPRRASSSNACAAITVRQST